MAEGNSTIAAGGSAQTLMPASPRRKGFWVQNNSSGVLTVAREDVAASASGPLTIQPGDYFESPAEMPVTGKITIWGETTGQAFGFGEW